MTLKSFPNFQNLLKYTKVTYLLFSDYDSGAQVHIGPILQVILPVSDWTFLNELWANDVFLTIESQRTGATPVAVALL